MKLQNHLTEEEILKRFTSQTKYDNFINWQIIYSVQKNPGKSNKEISAMLGLSSWKIFRVVEEYNKEGKTWQGGKAKGGRRAVRSFLSLEEEEKLLNTLEKKALNGMVLTYNDIKQEIENKLERKVSDDYIWDLFKRHGWKKKAPRPKHPLQKKEDVEDFKKNSKRIWQPPHY